MTRHNLITCKTNEAKIYIFWWDLEFIRVKHINQYSTICLFWLYLLLPWHLVTYRTEPSNSMGGTQVVLWHPHNKNPAAQDEPGKCLWEHTRLHSRMVSLLDKNYTNYCRAQNSISVLNTVPHQFVPATHCNITAMFHCLKACSSPQHLWVLCICFLQKHAAQLLKPVISASSISLSVSRPEVCLVNETHCLDTLPRLFSLLSSCWMWGMAHGLSFSLQRCQMKCQF